MLVTDGGEVRDLGEAMELPGSVGLDAELVPLLDLEVDGATADAAAITRVLFGQNTDSAEDTERALHGYLLRLGRLIQELS